MSAIPARELAKVKFWGGGAAARDDSGSGGWPAGFREDRGAPAGGGFAGALREDCGMDEVAVEALLYSDKVLSPAGTPAPCPGWSPETLYWAPRKASGEAEGEPAAALPRPKEKTRFMGDVDAAGRGAPSSEGWGAAFTGRDLREKDRARVI